ncbi:trace amine-associated receptor 13c-like [Chanos chanos]|uniref:Trace amine-associated receptor 13c-like n=1 Tax=Chanos chanos TaxID=29144 RepID=A0A6J2VY90_CHACN|nr:trace amine-associated receptor 13c-like [Chanos chanos]
MRPQEVNKTDYCLQSCIEKPFFNAVHTLLYVIAGAFVLFTVFGNLLVIISVCHFKQLHTPSNILVTSLALSDFLVGLFVMPLHLTFWIESCWLFGVLFCGMYNYVACHLTSVSVYNVVLIAVDRYFALSNPFLYSRKISLSVMCTVTLLNWLLSFIYNYFLVDFKGILTNSKQCPGECDVSIGKILNITDLVVVFLFPTAAIILLYAKIFVIVKRHAGAIRDLTNHRKPADGKSVCDHVRSESKAAKVFGILVSVFLACLVPYYFCTLVADYISAEQYYLLNFMLTLFYANSSINPIIYALFYPWFKRSIKLILTLHVFNTESTLTNVLTTNS